MTSETYHILGVDGGGSGCRAAITDRAGQVLGRGESGPANATSDMERAVANVRAAVAAAADAGGLDAAALRAAVAHVGLAGVMTAAAAAHIAARLPVGAVTVTDDRPTCVAGALGARPGVLMAIGTGSFAALSRGGTLRFAGGWGFQVSDQASGAWLGRALLERVLLAHDGLVPHSDLTRATLDRFGDPGAIVGFAAAASPADFAAHAPEVLRAARAGDDAGQALMRRGADYLARVLDRFGLRETEILCLTGGLGPAWADWLPEPAAARLAAAEGTALDGALRLARRVAAEGQGAA